MIRRVSLASTLSAGTPLRIDEFMNAIALRLLCARVLTCNHPRTAMTSSGMEAHGGTHRRQGPWEDPTPSVQWGRMLTGCVVCGWTPATPLRALRGSGHSSTQETPNHVDKPRANFAIAPCRRPRRAAPCTSRPPSPSLCRVTHPMDGAPSPAPAPQTSRFPTSRTSEADFRGWWTSGKRQAQKSTTPFAQPL